MAGGSVDGLISGLSTSQVIDQLMSVEARGQLALRNKVRTHQTVQSAYQAVNSRMTSLLNAASGLNKTDTWQAVKATSSSDAVTATASAGAQTGTFSFDVVQLATTASWSTTSSVAGNTDILTGPLTVN